MMASRSDPTTLSTYPKRPPTFLTLPPEIRNYIYDLAIFNTPSTGASRPVQLIRIGSQLHGTEYSNYPPRFSPTISLTAQVRFSFSEEGLEWPEDESPCSLPHNLFSTCRQIRRETRESYYSHNTFVVHMTPAGISTFKDWLDDIGNDACDFLQTIMLVFISQEYETIFNRSPARILILDLSTVGKPRTIIFPNLSSAVPAGMCISPSVLTFQTSVVKMPVVGYLMAGFGADAVSMPQGKARCFEHDAGDLREEGSDDHLESCTPQARIIELLGKEWRTVVGAPGDEVFGLGLLELMEWMLSMGTDT